MEKVIFAVSWKTTNFSNENLSLRLLNTTYTSTYYEAELPAQLEVTSQVNEPHYYLAGGTGYSRLT